MPARSRSRSVSRNRRSSFSADAVTRRSSGSEGETGLRETSIHRAQGNSYGTTIVGGQARVHLGDVNKTHSSVYHVTHSHIHNHGVPTQASPHPNDLARHVASAVTGGLIVLAGSSLSSARSGRLSNPSAPALESNKSATLEKRTLPTEECVSKEPVSATTNLANQPFQTGQVLVKEYDEWLQRRPLSTVRKDQLEAKLSALSQDPQQSPIERWLNDTQDSWVLGMFKKRRIPMDRKAHLLGPTAPQD